MNPSEKPSPTKKQPVPCTEEEIAEKKQVAVKKHELYKDNLR